MDINRRSFLSGSAAALIGAAGGCTSFCGGERYPGWRPGEMDIHFIHTGQGECTFFIFPDGTTMLLDCGYVEVRKPGYAEALPAAPSSKRRSGEWIRRYLERLFPQREIDYLMISHWHSDHVDGLPDVLESFRFKNYYDHQFPFAGKYSTGIDQDQIGIVRRYSRRISHCLRHTRKTLTVRFVLLTSKGLDITAAGRTVLFGIEPVPCGNLFSVGTLLRHFGIRDRACLFCCFGHVICFPFLRVTR
jgi:hypothetical protein